jgi:GTP pyrophosphokinase
MGGSNDPKKTELVKKAFLLANEACKRHNLRWGKPTILHALGTATIAAKEIGLGTTGIIAALLSEYSGDRGLAYDHIRTVFGEKVAEISEGLQRISGIRSDKSSSQAENFRNLILTMARDVRVILIKIAERLYIMRILETLPSELQIEIASETRFIYSPLAHRLGLYNIMSEMEDLAMKCLEPEAYEMIDSSLQATRVKRNRFIREFIRPLDEELKKADIHAEIKGRPKAISSIWRKMRKQKVDFDEVYDKFAIRIIIDATPKNEKADCWRVYSVISDLYRPNPERMRDWISVPKTNGYESLHTTVVVPGGEWVEIQIRTRRMDEIAEKGLAAHWKYKGIKGEQGIDEWMQKFRELLESPDADALNVIDDLKMSLDNKEIFVFTPKGDLKKFPEGATVLDFAFDIHSAVGVSCNGAKVNGKNVPIRYPLHNGDKVEIIRSKTQKPNLDWLNFVVTSKAKTKIKLALKEEKLKEAENGKEILKRRFKNWKLEFKDPLIRKLLQHYKYNDSIDLYHDVSTEKIDLLEIKEVLTTEAPKPETIKNVPIEEQMVDKILTKTLGEFSDYLLIDDKLAGVDYRLGKCCNPIFGDRIFGFVTIGSGITIHRVNCPNAQQLISKYGYRVVKARWNRSDREHDFLASVRITGIDDIGIVSNISEVISKDLKVKMRTFQMDSGDGLFEGTINLYIKDTEHLEVLIHKLAKVKGVTGVRRLEGN